MFQQDKDKARLGGLCVYSFSSSVVNSKIDAFHKRQKAFLSSEKIYNREYIDKSYPSITITKESGLENFSSLFAVVVNKQKEEEAYIYTDLNKPLMVGSVWSAKGLSWLVAEEIVIIKDVNWRKYYCYKCNAEVNGQKCYFVGPKKKAINLTLKINTFLESTQKPVLVAPSGLLELGAKFTIKNRAWQVDEYDDLSSDGITYYTLRETTMDKPIKTIEERVTTLNDGTVSSTTVNTYSVEPEIKENSTQSQAGNAVGNQDSELDIEDSEKNGDPIYVLPRQTIVLSTIHGDFSADNYSAIMIEQRTSTQIKFSLNYNATVTVTVCNEKGRVSKVYTTIRKED